MHSWERGGGSTLSFVWYTRYTYVILVQDIPYHRGYYAWILGVVENLRPLNLRNCTLI